MLCAGVGEFNLVKFEYKLPYYGNMEELDLSLRKQPFTLSGNYYVGDDAKARQRRVIMVLLGNILDKYEQFKTLSRENQNTWVDEIETSCFNKALDKANEDRIYIDWENPKFAFIYQLICSRVSKNLDKNSEVGSSWLFDMLWAKTIGRDEVAYLSSEELVNKPKDIQEMISLRRKQKLNYKTSTLYTCKNCKAKKCTVRTQQMRSLDEGFTIILNCTICGFRFMISG